MHKPLVSIAVITYNSSITIEETLDSIYNQSYRELELIISDDCSTDETVDICKRWIANNSTRFVRVQLLLSSENRGISKNLNNAEKSCNGVWIKPIAGDDILMPNCIQDYLDYIEKNQDAMIIFGKIKVIGENPITCSELSKCFDERIDMMSRMSQSELYEYVLSGNTPPAPSCFVSSKLYLKFGTLNDERFTLIEDWPKWLFLLKHDICFHFLDKDVVTYRLGGLSNSKRWESLEVYKEKRKLFYFYIWDYYYDKDSEFIIQKAVEDECYVYQQFLSIKDKYEKIKSSYSYKTGRFIISLFNCLPNFVKKIFK